jgi:hypothetical protein
MAARRGAPLKPAFLPQFLYFRFFSYQRTDSISTWGVGQRLSNPLEGVKIKLAIYSYFLKRCEHALAVDL